jgi:ABC-type bacteriocin/lantibiotic exporter with double-glycine peptidase domain
MDINLSTYFRIIKRLWRSISMRRKMSFLYLFALTVLASIAELLSIGSILPLLGALAAPEKLQEHFTIKYVDYFFKLVKTDDLLSLIIILFCIFIICSAIIRTFTVWYRTRLIFSIGSDLSTEIYRRTLFQPYCVHLSRNSSEVMDAISGKVNSVILSALAPLIVILSNSVMLVIIIFTLFFFESRLVIIVLSAFSVIYFGIYLAVRKRMEVNGQEVALSSTLRIKSLQEGLGGARDILLDNSQSVYCAEYQKIDEKLRRAQADNTFTSEVPRFFIEAMGMIFIAILALYLNRNYGNFAVTLPIIGTLAVAAQRILPLLQQIYYGFASLSGSQRSLLDTLDLVEQPLPFGAFNSSCERLSFRKNLALKNIWFKYQEQGPWVIAGLNLNIEKGSRIGIVGITGSGKSTLLDILMGLLEPVQGEFLVDNRPVNQENLISWRQCVAHVPQYIFLTDASVAENIAFGVPKNLIDMERVRKAAEQAQIAVTIESWTKQYDTHVGERGVRLSGGQRQRIGIARALYKQSDVLIFDEATSALDIHTEEAVMESIQKLGREKTIIIVAHRLSTLGACDYVVSVASGRTEMCTISPVTDGSIPANTKVQ